MSDKIRDNLEKFVRDVLKEDKISPYDLSKRTGCHETLWKNFLDGRTKMPDSGAIVALADYKNAPLDKVIGRDLAKEMELKKSKERNISKEVESKIPAFLTQLPTEALQSVMQVKEKAEEFRHRPTSNKQKKSFAEQVKPPNKPRSR